MINCINHQDDKGLVYYEPKGPVNADDCVLREVRAGVWSCTEWKSGKVFMVRR